jgi:hypothetical protein
MRAPESTREAILKVFLRKGLPSAGEYLARVDAATAALDAEGGPSRPFDSLGRPGGLIRLAPDIPTVIVPDLHARTDFLVSLLLQGLPDGLTVLDALDRGSLQILCLGDGFHAEARALERWEKAYEEFVGGYAKRSSMNQEMRESLSLMEMVMICKAAFPKRFHFLKGNHENVLNEEGAGNHPFRKFAAEGIMVTEFLGRFYGLDFLARYAGFEKRLPLFAVGSRFLASHAEPKAPYTERALIDAALESEVVLGLTWTDNGAADPTSVSTLLDRFLPGLPSARYFTGHRPIRGTYRELSGGRHLQIHNPDRFIVAWIMPSRDFDPELDIGEIRNISFLLRKSSMG